MHFVTLKASQPDPDRCRPSTDRRAGSTEAQGRRHCVQRATCRTPSQAEAGFTQETKERGTVTMKTGIVGGLAMAVVLGFAPGAPAKSIKALIGVASQPTGTTFTTSSGNLVWAQASGFDSS